MQGCDCGDADMRTCGSKVRIRMRRGWCGDADATDADAEIGCGDADAEMRMLRCGCGDADAEILRCGCEDEVSKMWMRIYGNSDVDAEMPMR